MKSPGARLKDFISEFFATFRFADHKYSIAAISLALTATIIGLVLVYLVDVRSVISNPSSHDMWWHLYRQGGPIEWGQWFFNSLTLLICAHLSGVFRQRGDKKTSRFWILIAITFMLMVIEDSGDPRHVIASYVSSIWGLKTYWVEIPFFACMVAPLGYAFYRYGRQGMARPQNRLYTILGILMYGFVASTSAMREVGSFYYVVGDYLSERLIGGTIEGFFLMEKVYEETLELNAAAMFCAGILVYFVTLKVSSSTRKKS